MTNTRTTPVAEGTARLYTVYESDETTRQIIADAKTCYVSGTSGVSRDDVIARKFDSGIEAGKPYVTVAVSIDTNRKS